MVYGHEPKDRLAPLAKEETMSQGHFQGKSVANDQPSRRIVLASWKDLATYVGKGVRTVQRWESALGFPVRRSGGPGKSAVVAFTDEVDSWFAARFKKSVHGGSQSELQRLRERNAELLAENRSLRRMLKE
jgi:ATP-dependent 26S proteasome regulatory subunit